MKKTLALALSLALAVALCVGLFVLSSSAAEKTIGEINAEVAWAEANKATSFKITIGGKTGTAQVSKNKSDNAIFTAFAPFDDPEIVVTCVIEQGNTGSNAGVAVKGLFDYYFGVEESPETPEDNTDGGSENEE